MIRWTTIILLIIVSCSSHTVIKEEKKSLKQPNIVFIMVDDMGWKDASCYGRKMWQTPRIDEFAKQGCRFTNAYAHQLCSPTRSSFMTGKHPARLAITDWIPGFENRPESPLLPVTQNMAVPLEETTIAEALKEKGYVTGIIGKWHIGNTPDQQGFQEVMETTEQKGRTRFDKNGRFMADRKGDAAIKFLETHKKDTFFLYFSFDSVHLRLAASKEKIAKHPNTINPTYAGMMEHVDDNVGRVLDKIHELGLDDNTIVMFYSDNGGVTRCNFKPLIYTSNFPLRANKGSLYEGGLRVPLIIRWPGVTKAGSTTDEMILTADFYPTILDMVGIEAKPQQHVDGINFSQVLRGEKSNRNELYWHYPHYSRHIMGYPSGAVRIGEWKLIEWFEDGKLELYNLKEDIGEQNNQADHFPKKVDELFTKLRSWRQQVSARMPERKVK